MSAVKELKAANAKAKTKGRHVYIETRDGTFNLLSIARPELPGNFPWTHENKASELAGIVAEFINKEIK